MVDLSTKKSVVFMGGWSNALWLHFDDQVTHTIELFDNVFDEIYELECALISE